MISAQITATPNEDLLKHFDMVNEVSYHYINKNILMLKDKVIEIFVPADDFCIEFKKHVVEDDGIGREISLKNKFTDLEKTHQSKGVRLTQSRLELNNMLNQRNASVEIIDKTNGNGGAAGTKVIVVFSEE